MGLAVAAAAGWATGAWSTPFAAAARVIVMPAAALAGLTASCAWQISCFRGVRSRQMRPWRRNSNPSMRNGAETRRCMQLTEENVPPWHLSRQPLECSGAQRGCCSHLRVAPYEPACAIEHACRKNCLLLFLLTGPSVHLRLLPCCNRLWPAFPAAAFPSLTTMRSFSDAWTTF